MFVRWHPSFGARVRNRRIRWRNPDRTRYQLFLLSPLQSHTKRPSVTLHAVQDAHQHRRTAGMWEIVGKRCACLFPSYTQSFLTFAFSRSPQFAFRLLFATFLHLRNISRAVALTTHKNGFSIKFNSLSMAFSSCCFFLQLNAFRCLPGISSLLLLAALHGDSTSQFYC